MSQAADVADQRHFRGMRRPQIIASRTAIPVTAGSRSGAYLVARGCGAQTDVIEWPLW
jgi:hypothetical protein